MRILFFVHTLGRTRHFRSVIGRLVERGHTVILAAARQQQLQRPKAGFYGHPNIELAACPMEREDKWAAIVGPFRRTRDYLRFFDPRFAHASKLSTRAAEHAPAGWNRAIARHPWLKRHWRLVQRGLALAETVAPCDAAFRGFLEECSPDLVLVTPLVDFGSYQTDYVKCAHQLGVPVLYLPFSWDNLTSRGMIHAAPDCALVWNKLQQDEAVTLHGVPASRIVVTGAPRFDEFFAMTPDRSREAFCAALGFNSQRPMLLYVCSAKFIGPPEVDFVRQWIAALRAAPASSWVRDANVLVRPHPANLTDWKSANLSDLPSVAVWSTRSILNADQGLYDSLYHSTAVVGLNTSAMIEAAIVGRPVYTIVAPEFAGGQGGTLHFWYLLVDNGGVVFRSDTFEEHLRQLAEAPAHEAETRERCRRFLESFIRPRGLDVPAGHVMVEEIERAASMGKRPRAARFWHHPLRWGLDAAVRAGFDPSLDAS
ncbi:MAG TPA: hypothetical protein VN654_14635 [Vicinamibacterales bacterium]|jgi:hypothetical protein|nr:hypothetical protein [Vicinamibacterales bacterium]